MHAVSPRWYEIVGRTRQHNTEDCRPCSHWLQGIYSNSEGKVVEKCPFPPAVVNIHYLYNKDIIREFLPILSTHGPFLVFTGVLIFMNILRLVDSMQEWCQKAPAVAAHLPRCETYAFSVCMAGKQSNTGQDSHSTFIHFQFMTTPGTLPTC